MPRLLSVMIPITKSAIGDHAGSRATVLLSANVLERATIAALIVHARELRELPQAKAYTMSGAPSENRILSSNYS